MNDPAVVAEVVAAFERYEAALVANNVDALDEFMWRDPRTVRIGVDDRQDGVTAISAFRRAPGGARPRPAPWATRRWSPSTTTRQW